MGYIILYKDIDIPLSINRNEKCSFNGGLDVQDWLEAGEEIDNTPP